MDQQLAKLRLPEWNAIQAKAKTTWIKTSLGTRPTFEEVRKTLPNAHQISILEWAAMIVLIVLTIFTSYKVGALAIPFATKSLDILSQHIYMSDSIRSSFVVVTALLFMLLATPSVIYFKLLAHEPEVTQERKETRFTPWYAKVSLDYLTPRLPSAVVYFSVGWLVYISGQLPGTVFENFLPVVVEVALATLVGNILQKRTKFNKLVHEALNERTAPYDLRLKHYEVDPEYLRTLYQFMREDIVHIKRLDPNTKRDVKVNAWLEQVDERVVRALLQQEYKRLMSGAEFATSVLNKQPEALPEPEVTGKRIPPNGMAVWTPESLHRDLMVRGLDPKNGYNEFMLADDYDSNYKPRAAWRAGARELFLGK